MTKTIFIIHYTPPNLVGGVERVIHEHARLLAARGYEVELIAGRSGRGAFPVHVIPELHAARPVGTRIERELAEGLVTDRFYRVRDKVLRAIAPLLSRADTVIAHNAFTLHFSLPLTAALWDIVPQRGPGATIAWCHDLSWTNPLYIPAMHEGYPWDLLRLPAPNTTYVAVSEERREELNGLWHGSGDAVQVVPNGIDAREFLRLSAGTWDLAHRFRLFDRDAVLLLPVRITRRKNVEAGIRAVRALMDRGLDVCFLISGPTAPHHPGSSGSYLRELKGLTAALGLDENVVFLADALGATLTMRSVAELYALADALLFPSAQEGFGLPILEAGLARLPAVLSNLGVFREVSGGHAWMFGLDDDPDTIAARILAAIETPTSRLYRRVIREYRWDAIVDRSILPLLERNDSHLAGCTNHAFA